MVSTSKTFQINPLNIFKNYMKFAATIPKIEAKECLLYSMDKLVRC